jgi:8-oxo-dGTP diphosphatase
MKLRLLSTAVLFNENDLLMMKRSPNRTLSPGMWAAVGGHVEPYEIADPRAACLREIEEETGLPESDIRDLTLRYILIRLRGSEVRQQFVYFGRTAGRALGETTEGELHWIPLEQVSDRNIPYIYRAVLEHYFRNGPAPHVWVATAGQEDTDAKGSPAMHWAPLIDPEVN